MNRDVCGLCGAPAALCACAPAKSLGSIQHAWRAQARELTNEALAIKFGVHRRTIEKLLCRETHYHVR